MSFLLQQMTQHMLYRDCPSLTNIVTSCDTLIKLIIVYLSYGGSTPTVIKSRYNVSNSSKFTVTEVTNVIKSMGHFKTNH